MKVIALETLIMSGVIVEVGETVDLDESVIENLEGLVKPLVSKETGKTTTKVVPPVTDPATKVVPPVTDTVVDAKSQELTDPEISTEDKKEGKSK